MTHPKLPPHEAFRVATLNDYEILDTPTEQQFDRIARLACFVMQTPLSIISLVDCDRQWFKAVQGLGIRETTRAVSFCAHGLDLYRPLIVTDARTDARFADNPFVIDGTMRAYVGAPLVAPNGMCLGMICVATPETMPDPSGAQLSAMGDLGDMVMRELEQRRLGPAWQEQPCLREQRQTLRREVRDLLDTRQPVAPRRDGGASPERPSGLPPRPVDAVAAIDDAVLRLGKAAARRDVRLHHIARVKNWAVLAETETLATTLLQLGLNAIAACPRQGTVTVSIMHSSFGMTDINVFNAGRALDPADCARALTPLGQPSAVGGTGTGVGLPIARVAIERLGGSIGLRGAPEIGGTIATVTLPTAPTMAARTGPSAIRKPSPHGAATMADCLRIAPSYQPAQRPSELRGRVPVEAASMRENHARGPHLQ